MDSVAETVVSFHRNGVAHRDLFSRNVILSTSSLCPVFIDFGLSAALDDPSEQVTELIDTDARGIESLLGDLVSYRIMYTWMQNTALRKAYDPVWTGLLLRMRDDSLPRSATWLPLDDKWWGRADKWDKQAVVLYK